MIAIIIILLLVYHEQFSMSINMLSEHCFTDRIISLMVLKSSFNQTPGIRDEAVSRFSCHDHCDRECPLLKSLCTRKG